MQPPLAGRRSRLAFGVGTAYKYRVHVVLRRLLGAMRGDVDTGSRALYRVLYAAGGLVLVTSLGFYLTESPQNAELTYGDAVWWSVVTMTTVGYGDLFPQTWAGRWLFGLPAMVMGVGVLGYLISLLATVLIERRTRRVGIGRLAPHLMVQSMQDPGFNAVVSDLLSNVSGHQLYIEPVGQHGGTYGELRAKLVGRTDMLPLGLMLEGSATLLPAEDTRIEPAHRLVFLGARRALDI